MSLNDFDVPVAEDAEDPHLCRQTDPRNVTNSQWSSRRGRCEWCGERGCRHGRTYRRPCVSRRTRRWCSNSLWLCDCLCGETDLRVAFAGFRLDLPNGCPKEFCRPQELLLMDKKALFEADGKYLSVRGPLKRRIPLRGETRKTFSFRGIRKPSSTHRTCVLRTR